MGFKSGFWNVRFTDFNLYFRINLGQLKFNQKYYHHSEFVTRMNGRWKEEKNAAAESPQAAAPAPSQEGAICDFKWEVIKKNQFSAKRSPEAQVVPVVFSQDPPPVAANNLAPAADAPANALLSDAISLNQLIVCG